METIVSGGVKQVSMHMLIPASDMPGTIDDWEVRSLAVNGRAARLIISPAVPRYFKKSEDRLAMQMESERCRKGRPGKISAAMTGASAAMEHM
jgi:hypothetical protein